MYKTERLFRLVLLLRRDPVTTAATLAHTLEVSRAHRPSPQPRTDCARTLGLTPASPRMEEMPA